MAETLSLSALLESLGCSDVSSEGDEVLKGWRRFGTYLLAPPIVTGRTGEMG